ncbi:hypothetical protein Micbo1qcDRAFT_201184 [Microdochium bolleyi]|uniref:DNA polymerase lambda n=1 Tax=Microdochium bolleyi TaxID=196109 RepID=A0A136JFC5_9PEZI|nr:hypothetical protein Micbo1qcDRAFT_201184 [Microdochium bolleyi]
MDPPLRDKIASFKGIQALQDIGSGKHADGYDDEQFGQAEDSHRQRCAAFRRAHAAAASNRKPPDTTIIPATQIVQGDARVAGQATPMCFGGLPPPTGNTPTQQPLSSSQQSSDGDVEIIRVTPLPRQSHQGQQTRPGKARRRATADDSPSDTSIIPDSTRRPRPGLSSTAASPSSANGSGSKRRATHPLARVLNNTSPTSPSQAPAASTAVSAKDMSPSVSTASARGRKGKDSLKMVPEDRQVFKGLSFYYVPNNDINAVRKARITKAREHGATWARHLSERPTHAIVDKLLGWDNIVSEDGWPGESALVVVNEDYPLHCISYRKLVNPQQPQYLVRGAPAPVPASPTPVIVPATAVPEPESSAATETSEVSLKLKPKHNNPARWDYVPPDNTPPRSEEASAAQQSSAESRVPQSQPGNTKRKALAAGDDVHEVGDEERDCPLPSQDLGLDGVSHISETVLLQDSDPAAQPDTSEDDEDELLSCIRDIKDSTDEVRDLLGTTGTDEEDAESDTGPATQSSTTRRTTRSTARSATVTTKGTWQDQFACMRAGAQGADAGNPNSRTIELLQGMLDHNEQVNDQWRTMSYKKAIAALKRHPERVTTAEQARGIRGIGQNIGDKIEEIVRTDRLRKLEYVQNDPQFQVLQLFLKIYGVGIKQAQQWMAKGYTTLEDVRARAQLNAGQKVGLEHFDDLNTRIPRVEVAALGQFVMAAAAELDASIELIIGGSYRRGSRSSGDIDFIVTKKGTSSTDPLVPFLHALVEKLYAEGFLTATLSSLAAEVKQGHGSKWHGCCVLPADSPAAQHMREHDAGWKPVWRRIDFLLVPDAELGAAMIYFTGDDIFNRSLRLLADKKGMRLNQRGLYRDVLRGPKRVKMTEGELVEGHDEKRIFEILGVKWREPHERWCQ